MGTVQRIGLRRTQAVDDLLRGIWELRPELERKNTMTILLGLESFLRECKVHAQTGHSSLDSIYTTHDKEVVSAELESMTSADECSSVSDDIEW